MGGTFSFVIAFLSILFLITSIILSIRNYKNRFKTDFDLRNHFPFETNYEGKFFDNLFGNTTLLFSLLFGIVFYSTFEGSRANSAGIFVFATGVFSFVLSGFLFFMPLKNLKTHVLLSTFQFAISFSLSAATFLLNFFYWGQNENILNIIAFIFAGLIAIFLLLLVLNPKLSLRINGKEKKLDNGEVVMIRPKFIVYGFSEWLSIFSIYLNMIPIILFLMSIL